MCVVCDKTQTVYDASQELMVGIAGNANRDEFTMILTQGGEEPKSVNIQIRYCPWCGNDIAANRKAIAERDLKRAEYEQKCVSK